MKPCKLCGLNMEKDTIGAVNILFPNRPKVSVKDLIKIIKRKAKARGIQIIKPTKVGL
jgi:hypothetical protein